jgi:hypothetical protein
MYIIGHQNKITGGRKMHDNYIVSYNVNLLKKNMSVKTYNNVQKQYKTIYFSEVLTHFFRCIIDYNIISDICESEIQKFIKDNQKELVELDGFCWPIDYNTEQELIDFLITNKYKYIEINSSYGMFGWVIAKSYEISE